MDNEVLLTKIKGWKSQSENLRRVYDVRWAKNIKLDKGIHSDEVNTRSSVRKRSKIFFRKINATVWRLVAAFYSVFLREHESFKVVGRGPEDTEKARLLQFIAEYRDYIMRQTSSLFLKHIWALRNIAVFGIGIGKMTWAYEEDEFGNKIKDEPDFIVYPPEQVFPDFAAETPDKMRYIIFENYMAYDDLVDAGYQNLDIVSPLSVPANEVRSARHATRQDPLQHTGSSNDYGTPRGGEYPTPGTKGTVDKDGVLNSRYKVWEVFYKESNQTLFCVTDGGNIILKEPVASPYGRRFPVVMGVCLTEPHMLVGEGFPELLEGPQESYNFNLNSRKDNLALALNKMHIVNRFANVDLQSLVNSRAGGVVLADDAIGSVTPLETPDVTQSSYMEAREDDGMMQEMSGVTDILMGSSTSDKATVAQLNYSQASAKVDLYSAIVAETYFKQYYSLLVYMIQRFETDETAFRVANAKLRKETGDTVNPDIFDLDFFADVEVEVGIGAVGKDIEIKNLMLCMDRAIMANQSTIALMQTGMTPQGSKIFDLTKFMDALLPKLGHKNIQDFTVALPSMQPPMQGAGGAGGGGNGSMAGSMEPQLNNMQMPNLSMENNLQQGSLGGI